MAAAHRRPHWRTVTSVRHSLLLRRERCHRRGRRQRHVEEKLHAAGLRGGDALLAALSTLVAAPLAEHDAAAEYYAEDARTRDEPDSARLCCGVASAMAANVVAEMDAARELFAAQALAAAHACCADALSRSSLVAPLISSRSRCKWLR